MKASYLGPGLNAQLLTKMTAGSPDEFNHWLVEQCPTPTLTKMSQLNLEPGVTP